MIAMTTTSRSVVLASECFQALFPAPRRSSTRTSRQMTKARRLDGRSVVVFFGLASFDRLTRDRLVGVAGQSAHNDVILHLNTKPGPSVMGFPFDLEAQPEVTVLHIHPTAHVVHGGGP